MPPPPSPSVQSIMSPPVLSPLEFAAPSPATKCTPLSPPSTPTASPISQPHVSSASKTKPSVSLFPRYGDIVKYARIHSYILFLWCELSYTNSILSVSLSLCEYVAEIFRIFAAWHVDCWDNGDITEDVSSKLQISCYTLQRQPQPLVVSTLLSSLAGSLHI